MEAPINEELFPILCFILNKPGRLHQGYGAANRMRPVGALKTLVVLQTSPSLSLYSLFILPSPKAAIGFQ